MKILLMKTILVPTDFSKASINAIDYAMEIAKLLKAKLILYHVYHIPVMVTEITSMETEEDIEKLSILNLKKIKEKLLLKHGKEISISFKTNNGNVEDRINLFTKNNKIDLIVMGIKGGGFLKEKIIGSITTSVLRKAICPVIAVDQKVKFKTIKKIVFACDYANENNAKILKPLKEIANLFDVHIYVLKIAGQFEICPSPEELELKFKDMKKSLKDFEHTYHCAYNVNVVDGINEFVETKKIDMVVMIPQRYTLIDYIFHTPETKKMAFHSKVPLLALH
jgi:nucleotide-binding universal stress UspA family protein